MTYKVYIYIPYLAYGASGDLADFLGQGAASRRSLQNPRARMPWEVWSCLRGQALLKFHKVLGY